MLSGLCDDCTMIHGPIVTERFILRPLEVDDATEMVELLADFSLYGYSGGEPPTLEELQTRYRRQVSGSADPGESWLNWIIRTSPDGHAIGFIQATVGDFKADLAWLVGVDHQGSGVATEATDAVKTWLVSKGVGRVEAHIHPAHDASRAVARRIGMLPTGAFDEDGEELWVAEPAMGVGNQLTSKPD